MNLTDFFENVEKDQALRGMDVILGDKPTEDRAIVEHLATGYRTQLLATTIKQHDWPTLREVALGQRDPAPIYHVTRIVGYFSRVENWNKSKLGELLDRRAGDYRLSPEQLAEDLPQMSKSA